MKEISEMKEGKKMNECKRGGAASIKGGVENKIKEGWGARVGPGFGLGRFGSWVGSREEYIRVVRALFPHFYSSFLSLPPNSLKLSVHSPHSHVPSSPTEKGGRNDSDAAAGESSRRHHRVGAKNSFFF